MHHGIHLRADADGLHDLECEVGDQVADDDVPLRQPLAVHFSYDGARCSFITKSFV